jgi:SOS-response transcriptional repressor LexA
MHSFHVVLWENDNSPVYKAGDSIVVDPDLSVKPGAMVLAIVDGKPFFRRFRQRGHLVVLVPENEDYESLERPSVEVRILGTLREHAHLVE